MIVLSEALELSGFEIVECRKRFLPYSIKSKLPKATWLVKLYLMIPFMHKFIGKQAFIYARKK